jgi:hypothetical protein
MMSLLQQLTLLTQQSLFRALLRHLKRHLKPLPRQHRTSIKRVNSFNVRNKRSESRLSLDV